MEIIGILFIGGLSLFLIFQGFGGAFFILHLTGKWSEASFLFALGLLGLYGIYYILFETLTVSLNIGG